MVKHYLNFANDKATDPLYVRSQASVGGKPLPVSVEFGNMFMQHVAKHQRGDGVLRPLYVVESAHHSGVSVCARNSVGQVGSRRRRRLRMRMRSLRHPLRRVERCALLLSRHCSCEHTNVRCWWVGGGLRYCRSPRQTRSSMQRNGSISATPWVLARQIRPRTRSRPRRIRMPCCKYHYYRNSHFRRPAIRCV
jgi:hypothetical protein